MLLEMNDDECEVQGWTNPAQASTAMDVSHLEHEQECNNFLCFHVQMCSIMLHDDELITRKCLGLKNFAEKSERKF